MRVMPPIKCLKDYLRYRLFYLACMVCLHMAAGFLFSLHKIIMSILKKKSIAICVLFDLEYFLSEYLFSLVATYGEA